MIIDTGWSENSYSDNIFGLIAQPCSDHKAHFQVYTCVGKDQMRYATPISFFSLIYLFFLLWFRLYVADETFYSSSGDSVSLMTVCFEAESHRVYSFDAQGVHLQPWILRISNIPSLCGSVFAEYLHIAVFFSRLRKWALICFFQYCSSAHGLPHNLKMFFKYIFHTHLTSELLRWIDIPENPSFFSIIT